MPPPGTQKSTTVARPGSTVPPSGTKTSPAIVCTPAGATPDTSTSKETGTGAAYGRRETRRRPARRCSVATMRAYRLLDWRRAGFAGVGLCHTDLHFLEAPAGAFPYDVPFTLGHENGGYVDALGAGVTGLAEG